MKKYDTYKDSGVKWIGEVPEHWEITPLKFCFNVLSGATPKSTELSYWEDGNINWITPADFKTEDRFISDGAKKITKEGFMSCSTTLIPSGSIIFSKRAPIGSVVINRNEVCTNQGCLSCIPKDDISSLFFYYIMSVSQKYFDMLGTGTTFNEISANVFKNVHLPVPPLSEQQSIASYLDVKTEKIDKIIAKAEKKIEYLGELKQSLITRAVTRGLNPNTPLKDSGVNWIGNIPMHWDIACLRFFLKLINGRAYSQNELLPSGKYKVLRVGNFFTNDSWYYSNMELEPDKYCDKDDLLYAWSASVGPYIWNEAKTIYHYHIWKVQLATSMDKMYSYYLLRAVTNQKMSDMHGSTMMHITMGDMNKTKIPIPPLSEQQQIATYLDTKCSKIDHIVATQKKKIAYLQELKQSLITNVVTGKIKVS